MFIVGKSFFSKILSKLYIKTIAPLCLIHTAQKVLEMYSMILPEGNAVVFVDQIFRVFDNDGNGSIDFKVICSGI